MDYRQKVAIVLKNCPCVLEVLDEEIGLFIAGTYELDEERSRANDGSAVDNNRKGSLVLIQDSKLILEYLCENGGVFDLKVLSPSCVVVAHSNGKLASYSVDSDRAIKLESALDTKSDMLTSVDVVRTGDQWIAAAGDSVGCVSVLTFSDITKLEDSSSKIDQKKLSADSIWRVKLISLSSDTHFLFSGADDCLLRMNLITHGEVFVEPLAVSREAGAGVTSIEVIKRNDESINQLVFNVHCGSYDEVLRFYELKVCANDNLKFELTLKQSIKIPGAGIWKTRKVNELLFVVGMYAGVFILNSSDGNRTLCAIDKFEDSSDGAGCQRRLIYDAVPGKASTDLLVASFYEKTVYWLVKNHSDHELKKKNA